MKIFQIIFSFFLVTLLFSCGNQEAANEKAQADSIARVRTEDSLAQLEAQKQEAATTTPTVELDPTKPAVAEIATGIFKELIGKAGLVETLNEAGPFTVFAPSDQSLSAVKSSVKDAEKLKAALSKHIVKGLYTVPDLIDGQELETISGEKLKVKIDGGVLTINGAEFVTMDEMAKNGVVHGISKVLN